MSPVVRVGWAGRVLLAVLTYALVLSAAELTGPQMGVINVGVESVASGAGAVLGTVGSMLPLGYAFGAGMVAAANPCGFALLPAYVGLYGRGCQADANHSSVVARLAHAARVGLTISMGFTFLFGLAGLLLGVTTSLLARLFPWIGLLVGVALVILGAQLAGGSMVYTNVGERIADRLGTRARRTGASSHFLYGLAYGAASLSCTLPIFLAVVGSGFTSGDYLAATVQCLLYALGMGLVVIGVTVAVALFQDAVVSRARHAVRFVQPASAALLLLAGAYIMYYWLTLGGLLAVVHRA